MEVKVVKATTLPQINRKQMSTIFVEGWYHDLKFFYKDKARLIKTFEHIFNLSCFYVGVQEEKILGFIAICDRKKEKYHQFNKKECRKNLGFLRGTFAYTAMKRVLDKPYPFQIPQNTGVIEAVGVHPSARGKGIAHQMLKASMEKENFDHYVLEVVDNNATAIGLYERLGFKEFTRIDSPYPEKYTGFKEIIYMALKK